MFNDIPSFDTASLISVYRKWQNSLQSFCSCFCEILCLAFKSELDLRLLERLVSLSFWGTSVIMHLL